MSNNRLQFSATRLDRRPDRYRTGEPPALPPLTQAASELDSAYPPLVSSLANAISQTANENPLRTYLFNQMSVNNWRNDEFRELASVAAIYTLAKLREGAHRQNGGVERFIEIIADKMVEARAAFNAQVDPELRYEVPERKIADVKNAARVWESVREDSWEALRRYREASQRNRYDSNRGWGNDRDNRGSQRSGGWGEDGYASQDRGYQNSRNQSSVWDDTSSHSSSRANPLSWDNIDKSNASSNFYDAPKSRSGLNVPGSATAKTFAGVMPSIEDPFPEPKPEPIAAPATNRWQDSDNAWSTHSNAPVDDYYHQAVRERSQNEQTYQPTQQRAPMQSVQITPPTEHFSVTAADALSLIHI